LVVFFIFAVQLPSLIVAFEVPVYWPPQADLAVSLLLLLWNFMLFL